MPALRKYLETTMSVASCDQPAGISAPSILKTTEPSGLLMTLERRSQVTWSSGSTPLVVKRRSKASPRAALFLALAFGAEADAPFLPSSLRADALPSAPLASLV